MITDKQHIAIQATARAVFEYLTSDAAAARRAQDKATYKYVTGQKPPRFKKSDSLVINEALGLPDWFRCEVHVIVNLAIDNEEMAVYAVVRFAESREKPSSVEATIPRRRMPAMQVNCSFGSSQPMAGPYKFYDKS